MEVVGINDLKKGDTVMFHDPENVSCHAIVTVKEVDGYLVSIEESDLRCIFQQEDPIIRLATHGVVPTVMIEAKEMQLNFNDSWRKELELALDKPYPKAIKTMDQWEKSGLNLDDFLQMGDEIDEDLSNYLGEVVAPQYCSHEFTQTGEASKTEDGVMFYSTVGRRDDRYFYLGVLPEFKHPEW